MSWCFIRGLTPVGSIDVAFYEISEHSAVTLEVLDGAFVFLGLFQRIERTEVSSLAGTGIFLC
jgi:hypothetical protein